MICLTACGKQSASLQNEPSSKSFFAMDTYMTITAYGENAASALEQAEERVTEYSQSGNRKACTQRSESGYAVYLVQFCITSVKSLLQL